MVNFTFVYRFQNIYVTKDMWKLQKLYSIISLYFCLFCTTVVSFEKISSSQHCEGKKYDKLFIEILNDYLYCPIFKPFAIFSSLFRIQFSSLRNKVIVTISFYKSPNAAVTCGQSCYTVYSICTYVASAEKYRLNSSFLNTLSPK